VAEVLKVLPRAAGSELDVEVLAASLDDVEALEKPTTVEDSVAAVVTVLVVSDVICTSLVDIADVVEIESDVLVEIVSVEETSAAVDEDCEVVVELSDVIDVGTLELVVVLESELSCEEVEAVVEWRLDVVELASSL
jgi:hypothetical protein